MIESKTDQDHLKTSYIQEEKEIGSETTDELKNDNNIAVKNI